MRSTVPLPVVMPAEPGPLTLPKDRQNMPAYWAGIRCFDEHDTNTLQRAHDTLAKRPEASRPAFSFVRNAVKNLAAELERRRGRAA